MASQEHIEGADNHEEDMLNAEDIGEEIEADEDHPMEGIDDEDVVEGGGVEEAMELQNDSIAHFDGHGDSVFSISSHPKQSMIVATGSGDETVFVWSSDPKPDLLPKSFQAGGAPEPPKEPGRASLIPITQLKGHKETVIATAFSQPDGDYLFTADMKGFLRAYTTNHGGLPLTDPNAYKLAAEVQEVEEITWLAACPNADRPNALAVGAVDGSVWVYEAVDQGDGTAILQILQTYYQHTSSCTAGVWTSKGDLLATVSEESSLYVFDPFGLVPTAVAGAGSPVVSLTADDQRFAVEGGLYSVSVSPGGTLCAVGGFGGAIRVVGLPRTATDPAAQPQGTTKSQKGGQGARAKAGGGKQAGASGTTAQASGSGQAGQIVATMNIGGDSVEALSFSRTGALLAAGDVDGNIRLFDASHNFAQRRHIEEAHENQAVVSLQWEGAGRLQGVSAANAPQILLSCGNDGVLKKWDARTGTLLSEFKGHRGGGDGGGIMAFVLPKDDDGRQMAVTAGDDGVSLVFDITA